MLGPDRGWRLAASFHPTAARITRANHKPRSQVPAAAELNWRQENTMYPCIPIELTQTVVQLMVYCVSIVGAAFGLMLLGRG